MYQTKNWKHRIPNVPRFKKSANHLLVPSEKRKVSQKKIRISQKYTSNLLQNTKNNVVHKKPKIYKLKKGLYFWCDDPTNGIDKLALNQINCEHNSRLLARNYLLRSKEYIVF